MGHKKEHQKSSGCEKPVSLRGLFVLGILLAALAVQFVLNGIAGYYKFLVNP